MRITAMRGGTVLGLVAAASLAFSTSLPGAAVALAADGDPILDLVTEDYVVRVDSTVTLTAVIYAPDGRTILTGPGTNTQVRFRFFAGSANEPAGGGASADLQCHTGQGGTCSVTYVPESAGIDRVCATTANGNAPCNEPAIAPERDNEMDTVFILVLRANGPHPTASPSASPAASPRTSPSSAPSQDPGTDSSDAPLQDPGATAPASESPSDPPSESPSESASASQSTDPGPLAVILPPTGGGTGTGRPGTSMPGPGSGAVSAPAPAPVAEPATSDGIFGIVQALIGSATDGAGRVISAEAAVTVASSFGFPIALALLVLLFLAVQPRVDKRDPKLSSAPRTLADTLVAFEDDAR